MTDNTYRAYVPYVEDSLTVSIAQLAQLHRRLRWSYSAADYLKEYPDAGLLSSLVVKSLDGSASEVTIALLKELIVIASPSILCTRQGHILAESVVYPALELKLEGTSTEQIALERRAFRSGAHLFLDGMYSNYFWHWVMEYLPKLLLAQAAGFDGTCVIGADRPPFALESLQLLGVPTAQVAVRGGEPWWAAEVCVPQALTGTAGHGRDDIGRHPGLLHLLRTRLLSGAGVADSQGSGRRLYISRKRAQRGRRVKNEQELVQLLQRYGFDCLVMEDLSLRQQLYFSSQAEVLIGPHGAGLLHCLFMPPRSLVVELYARGFEEKTNRAVIDLLAHRHVAISSAAEGDPYAGEFAVDLAEIDEVLRREL